ncbi:MAG TPA: TIGR04372 family glycosyltransferase [Gammaproteobacteria bacterium]|nr:TIGR04372 family glycosyltransferase [Gammaproteobacteria bacterium]
MKLISIPFPFKLSLLGVDRIGHLALEPELLLRKKYQKLRGANCFYILIADSHAKAANIYFYNLVKTHFFILQSYFLFKMIESFRHNRLIKQFNLIIIYPQDFNFGVECAKYGHAPTQIRLPAKDIAYGKELLRLKFNIDLDKNKIVCIFARDSQYLEKMFPNGNWSHHNHRDMDIDTFIKAIDYLCEQGYTVFRLGKVVAKAVNYHHPNFIDYALTENRSDFLDIFLIYIAYLTIGTPSGITDLPAVFNKSYLNLGFTPPFRVPLGENALYIPKKICFSDSKKELPFNELLRFFPNIKVRFPSFDSKDMERLNLSYVENTAEEILVATQEMINRLAGKWQPSEEEKNLEQCYLSHWQLARSHNFLKSPIALSWLKMNKHLLEVTGVISYG